MSNTVIVGVLLIDFHLPLWVGTSQICCAAQLIFSNFGVLPPVPFWPFNLKGVAWSCKVPHWVAIAHAALAAQDTYLSRKTLNIESCKWFPASKFCLDTQHPKCSLDPLAKSPPLSKSVYKSIELSQPSSVFLCHLVATSLSNSPSCPNNLCTCQNSCHGLLIPLHNSC